VEVDSLFAKLLEQDKATPAEPAAVSNQIEQISYEWETY
jgi:hypothetical protein